MTGFVVHAHVYQPPREDPISGDGPVEPTAAPHHDWNFRITDECYRPLAAALIWRGNGDPEKAVNLYGLLNFNVGPTLAVWLDRFAPDVMAAMQIGDARSAARHGGHGGAIAQPWVHAILPLASDRDRAAMVRWGISDFIRRFNRVPQGMWLPETAVDIASLETLAAQGIQFTILAPHQVSEIDDVVAPARILLPSGRSISVFVYNGTLAHRVAFGALLKSGAELAEAFGSVAESGLVSIATDAETFGHHHKFSEMALALALDLLGADVTTYGAWLREFPPTQTAQLVNDSSWSCEHGIERWRSDCGCRAGIGIDPDQAWRGPLRDSLTWLVGEVADLTDSRAHEALTNPWQARDGYVEVLTGAVDSADFIRRHTVQEATSHGAYLWLELHRHMLLAQSSCAWFFDDADGHEVELSLRHADLAMIQLLEVTGVSLSAEFSDRLGPRFSARVPLTMTT